MAKKDIHPEYFPQAKISCACGNAFTVGAAKPELSIDICSKCHPFYTGEEKLIDTTGRVERFKNRRTKAADVPRAAVKKEKQAKRSTKKS